jgi:nucleoside-diphosphate-sugar epimerase
MRPGVEWHRGDLSAGIDFEVFRGADALIHVAWATNPASPSDAATVNRLGARRLFEDAARAGVRTRCFVSSMSAHPRARSAYGRTKLAVESLLDVDRDLIVRPGFVLGNGGVFARLTASIRAAPFIPLFYGGRQPIQTIAVDDLCEGLHRALVRDIRGRVVLAHPEVLTIERFYVAIATALGQPRKPVLRLPGYPAFLALRLAERLGLTLPMTSENLLGLKALERADVAFDLDRVGLTPKGNAEVLSALLATSADARTHRPRSGK